MKITKPQSLTTDTRLSQSHFFNNSLLNKTNLTSTSQKNHHIPHNFQQQDSKQVDFLKAKNEQLQDRVKRMSQQIKQLEENKIYLLKMNEKYINVLNQYYRDLYDNPFVDITSTSSHLQTRINTKINENYNSQQKKSARLTLSSKEKSTQKQHSTSKQFNAFHVLNELQKDHRNLSKHVLVMQSQIKNYSIQMEKFNQMKDELLAVNHTTPKQLITELGQTVQENRELKKQNNRLSFQLEKLKSDCIKLKKSKQMQHRNMSANTQELEKLKAQINKVTQQSADKANHYEQRIYDLELKCQKLENQLRNSQIFTSKNEQKAINLQMQRVEDTHENTFLRSSLTELLDPKKHPLLKLDRSFVYKKKKQRSISLNKTINTYK